MEKPTADLSDLEIKSVNPSSGHSTLTIKGDVSIYNPYDHDLPILEITYKELVSGTVEDTGSVSANATSKIEIGFDVPFVDLLGNMGGTGTVGYTFDVEVKFNLPTSHSFTLPLHQDAAWKLPTLSEDGSYKIYPLEDAYQ